jgi:LacI family transcriptional regulator
LILTDVANSFFSEIAHSVQASAHDLGYSVIYSNTNDSLTREGEALDMLIERKVDGIIIVPLLEEGEGPFLRKLVEKGIPFLYLDRHPTEPAKDYIQTDDRSGVRQAMEYLISLGHRRIGCISAQPHTVNLRGRVRAYLDAMRSHGLETEAGLMHVAALPDDRGGYDAAKALFALSPRPTAICAVNDITAIGACRAAKEEGIAIPRDLSVVGFDDIEPSSHLWVPLTTVAQPIRKMGELAVQVLLDRIDGKGPKGRRRMLLEPRLVIRGSCAEVSTTDRT